MIKKQTIDIDRLHKNENNPRVIQDIKFEKLKTSIQDFPEMLNIRPVVVDENYRIVSGHMRYEACRELGYKEIPIIFVNDLSEEQKTELMIKDNRAFGEWDWDEIDYQYEFEELTRYGFLDDEIGIIEDGIFADEVPKPKKTVHTMFRFGEINFMVARDEYTEWYSKASFNAGFTEDDINAELLNRLGINENKN